MKRFAALVLVTLGAALALNGCSNPAKSYCAKKKECCAALNANACDAINQAGTGWEQRCEIAYNAWIDELGTYSDKRCGALSDALNATATCLGDVACQDIAASDTDNGYVAKCDAKAQLLCNAEKAAGDFCGEQRISSTNCDLAKGQFNLD